MTIINDEVDRALVEGCATGITPFPFLTNDAISRLRAVYDGLVPTTETLTLLFAVDAAQTAPSDVWTSFFVETASAQLIWDQRPTGVLSDKDASFVLARFDEAPTMAVLGLMVRTLEEAHRLPAWYAGAVRSRASLFRSGAATTQRAEKDVPYLRLVA